jgi:deoxyribose-phosphate aldolase
VESHVLRYWEEELHLPIKRNELGHRYYTKEDVELFKKYIGPKVKIKAAGGVSSMEDLEMFLELGCDRIGTSRAVGLCKGELTEGY